MKIVAIVFAEQANTKRFIEFPQKIQCQQLPIPLGAIREPNVQLRIINMSKEWER